MSGQTKGAGVLAAFLGASAQPPVFPVGGTAPAEGKLYRGGPRLSLLPPRVRPQTAGHCDQQGLSDLLFYSFGVSRLCFSAQTRHGVAPALRRPVGSGGALYPTQVYVSHQGIRGIPDGFSHFDPLHHQLEVLLYGDPLSDLEQASVGPALRPQITVLLTSASWNTIPKYQHFGYRLLTLELGMVAEQLAVVAAALSARCVVSPAWPSAFKRLLRSTDDELPGLRVSIEWPGPGTGPERPTGWTRTEAVSRPANGPGLTSCPLAWNLERAAWAGCTNVRPLEPIRAIGPHRVAGAAIFDTLRARRSSAGGFRNTPISGSALQAVLSQEVCEGGNPDDVALLVVARAVTRVRAGIYRFDPAVRRLTPVGCSSPNVLLHGGTPGNVEQSTQPAAWLYPVVTLKAESPNEARHYRDAQIRVGRLLQRLQLAFTTSGIQGHISLAYDVQAIQANLGLSQDRYPAAQLLLGEARSDTEGLNLDLWACCSGRDR